MGKIINPAAALMARLKFPQRFALISLLFVIPLGYALWTLVGTIDSQASFSVKEVQGDAYLRPLDNFYRDTIEDLLLSRAAFRGVQSANADIQANEAKIDKDFEALASVDAQYGGTFGTTSRLAALKESWNKLKATPVTADRQSSYLSIMAGTLDVVSIVGDSSNLILDPQLDTYYTVDATLTKLPALQNTLAQTAVQVDGVLARQAITVQESAQLSVLKGQLLGYMANLKSGAAVAFANNPSGNLKASIDGPLNATVSVLTDILNTIDTRVLQRSNSNITLSSDAWLGVTRRALQTSFTLWNAQVDQLDFLLNNRVATYETNRVTAISVTLIALLVVVYLWAGFYRAVMTSITNLEKSATLLASGNAPEAVTTAGRDELSKGAASAFSKMVEATASLNSAMEQRTSELTEVSYLLAYMHDGVVITDDKGVIKVLNGPASWMLSTTYDDAVNQPLVSFVQDARLQETLRAARNALTRRFAVDVQLSNRVFSISVTFIPVDEKVTGLLLMEDVTDLRTLQEQQHQYVVVSR